MPCLGRQSKVFFFFRESHMWASLPTFPTLTPTYVGIQQSQLHEATAIQSRTTRLSQTRLARLAGVSRFKICLFELGDGQLTDDEQRKIKAGLQSEEDALRGSPATL